MESCSSKGTEDEFSNRKIIMHPLYMPKSSSWFELRVFYVRLTNFEVDDSIPEYLTLNHIPLAPDTILEVNGRRSNICSVCMSSSLRRDRVDKKSEEVTFVSTDSIRMTGSVRFEVCGGDDHLLLHGILELCDVNGFSGEAKLQSKKWCMKCQSTMSAVAWFLKGKYASSELSLPIIEVYVAGCFSGSPIILTKTLQLPKKKKKQDIKLLLDSIPESEATDRKEMLPDDALQLSDYKDYEPENDEDSIDCDSFYSRAEYTEEEDAELSWFNTGVRVGIGIGLGICLGIGISFGVLVRTYQATTRNFMRRST